MEKLVSILLPTYQGAFRIKKSIESVIAQTYANWELLVIDDGSSDATAQIVAEIAKGDTRIRYEKNEKNIGIQKTLNKGVRASRGVYLARIDDDDIWIDPNKLCTQVDFLNSNQSCVLVGTGAIAVDEQGRELFRHCNLCEDSAIRHTMLAKNCFFHSSVLFRKETATAVGGYDESEETKHVEDYDLWLKLGMMGKLSNLPLCGVKIAVRADSLSSKNKVVQFKKSIQIIKKYRKLYPRYLFSVVSLLVRMGVHQIFRWSPLRSFYAAFYKLYKKI